MSGRDETITVNHKDNHFKELNDNLKELLEKYLPLVPQIMIVEDFVLMMQ